MADAKPIAMPAGATGVLVLASGETIWGRGFGAEGAAVGEVCFHTAMTGYQEIMTDPSFAGQMITFTFPHIGNVGANPDDVEADNPHALGMIVREDVTAPSNFRSVERLDAWMAKHGRIGLAGVDTRALTRRIRSGGAPNGVIAHAADGAFDVDALIEMARAWPGLEGMDLAKAVSTELDYGWDGGVWRLGFGYDGNGFSSSLEANGAGSAALVRGEQFVSSEVRKQPPDANRPHVVAIDYGSKRNIFRNLVAAGAKVSVVPATASFDQVMALDPDGIFLSNGPGDPAATGEYAVPVIRALLETGKPLFGICLGHQLLGLAVGARTTKMFQGHRGANHPVKRLADGTVEITSMNHGFAVERGSLPAGVCETHVSLFDGSNAGLELDGGRAFSVQYHPEASPGPQDSLYLFERFVGMMRTDNQILGRILSRDGLYWRYPGDSIDDFNRKRWVEMRIDVKLSLLSKARALLESKGWSLASQPDEPKDAIQRLYVRKWQSVDPAEREAMLVAGYEASEAGEGRLWSWLNVDGEQAN